MMSKSQYQALKDATISGFRKVTAGELITFADDHAHEWIDQGVLGGVGEYIAPEPTEPTEPEARELDQLPTEPELITTLAGGIE